MLDHIREEAPSELTATLYGKRFTMEFVPLNAEQLAEAERTRPDYERESLRFRPGDKAPPPNALHDRCDLFALLEASIVSWSARNLGGAILPINRDTMRGWEQLQSALFDWAVDVVLDAARNSAGEASRLGTLAEKMREAAAAAEGRKPGRGEAAWHLEKHCRLSRAEAKVVFKASGYELWDINYPRDVKNGRLRELQGKPCRFD